MNMPVCKPPTGARNKTPASEAGRRHPTRSQAELFQRGHGGYNGEPGFEPQPVVIDGTPSTVFRLHAPGALAG